MNRSLASYIDFDAPEENVPDCRSRVRRCPRGATTSGRPAKRSSLALDEDMNTAGCGRRVVHPRPRRGRAGVRARRGCWARAERRLVRAKRNARARRKLPDDLELVTGIDRAAQASERDGNGELRPRKPSEWIDRESAMLRARKNKDCRVGDHLRDGLRRRDRPQGQQGRNHVDPRRTQ